MRNQKGFTLIELAIVLIIIGMLIGLGAGMLGPLTKRAKLVKTRELIDAAVESLIGYGASNDKLPVTGSFSSAVKNPNDAWTKSLYYILDSNLTDTSIGGICGRKTTNLILKICPDTGCASPTNTINNVAFIVLSGGGNYNNQTAGTQAVSSSTTINTYEVDVSIDGYTGDMDLTEPYDDIVRWVTIDELRIKTGCVGSPLKIVNNELPFGHEDSAYTATIFGDGGVPFADGLDDTDSELDYEWCWEEDPINGAPAGVTFTCGTSSIASSTCSLTGGTWRQCTSLSLGGIPTDTGSFSITFFIRDENDAGGANDNISQRKLVLTLNPAYGGGGVCVDYRVWNNTGNKYDFYRDGKCKDIKNKKEITKKSNELLGSGETIERYDTNNKSCGGGIVATMTYADAQSADTNGNCDVNFDGTDK